MTGYYQTEALAPIEQEWVSASDVYRDEDKLVFPESKKLTSDEADAELDRLRHTNRNIDFRIAPYKGDL